MNENLDILRNLIIKNLKCDPLKKSRNREIIDAKKIFCLMAFNNVQNFKYVEIAIYCGINHATVIHHVKTAKDLLKYDPYFKKNYEKIEMEFFMLNKNILESDLLSEIKLLTIKLERLQKRHQEYMEYKEYSKKQKEVEIQPLTTTETLSSTLIYQG